ncbi:MAG: A/G-specific adenine glycosylase [Pseudomonadota bacterium]
MKKNRSKESATLVLPENPRFSGDLIAWQKTYGRHTLPWQNTTDAYRIWLSEIMLQQTQVAAVIPYYLKFLHRFPDVFALAEAPSEEVMAHWSGLGYYSRARNLHRCAREVVAAYDGVFPSDPALLAQLPGIGRSTAAAIAAFAYGTRAAIMDGNVKRVFARVFGIDTYPGERKTEQYLWQLAVSLLPHVDLQSYTQGLMDLGATLCTRSRPACQRCPLADRCIALATGRVAELPIRKPKKAVPEKHAVMLVVADRHQVLLTQRPEQGIWGGLLSLPELDGFTVVAHDTVDTPMMDAPTVISMQASIEHYLRPFGDVASCSKLQSFTHGFTHFKLHVVPYRVTLARRLDVVGETDQVWVDIERLDRLPLPAPVRKLLQELFRADDLFAA